MILSESNIQTYYHITQLPSAVDIVSELRMRGSDEEGSINRRIAGKFFNVCFSRNKTLQQGYGLHFWRNQQINVVYLTFDGEQLNSRYKIKPFDFMGSSGRECDRRNAEIGRQIYGHSFEGKPVRKSTEEDFYNHSDEDSDIGWAESEERLYTDSQYIPLSENTVSRADVITAWETNINKFTAMVFSFQQEKNYKNFFKLCQHTINLLSEIKDSIQDMRVLCQCVPDVRFYRTYNDFNDDTSVSFNGIMMGWHIALKEAREVFDEMVDNLYDEVLLTNQQMDIIQEISELLEQA